MGLFKWRVKLGESGEDIADGYIYSRSEECAIKSVVELYNDKWEIVVIEDDWDFDEDDWVEIVSARQNGTVDGNVIIRWEK